MARGTSQQGCKTLAGGAPTQPCQDHWMGCIWFYQAADDQVLEEINSDDERSLEVSAEEALRYEHGDVWIAVPTERLRELSPHG